MTLKAKVEAVVYAAEEPVTLAQLAAIFADEVLQQLEAAGTEDQPADSEAAQQTVEAAPSFSSDAPDEAQAPDQIQNQVQEPPGTGETAERKAARQRDRRARQALERIVKDLMEEYSNGDRGMEIREIAGGYRMATKPEYHDAVRGFIKRLKPPMKLSLQALETLAVVAYKQPVTAPEVSEIRGVDSGGVLGSLISRKLITTAGRKQVIGRPILYKTTKEFLLRFGLKDLNELPSMEEFEKMAGELADAEAEAEDAAMRSSELPFSSEAAGESSTQTEMEAESEAFSVAGDREPNLPSDANEEENLQETQE